MSAATVSLDVAVHDGASDAFAAEVRAAYARLPETVRARLTAAGVEIRSARVIADVWARDDLDHAPRGWPDGSSWAELDGGFFDDVRLVLVCEFYRTRGGAERPADRAAGALLHEAGHALDTCTGGSASPEFRDAYAAGFARLAVDGTDAERSVMQYEAQPGDDGPCELFAESLAVLYADERGGAGGPTTAALYRRYFPEALAVVRAVAEPLC